MEPLPIRVAVLHDGDPSAEQRAAYDWCERRVAAVDRVTLDTVDAGDVSLSGYDAVWWHRDAPPADLPVEGCGPTLREYLENGGGLLLTLCAVAAVEPLGIDAVAPDAVGRSEVVDETGFLIKAIHADHPLFESFDGHRVSTCGPGGEGAFARYERVLPERGDVLACTFRGDHDVYHEKSMVTWRLGAGRVVGAGAALAFEDPGDYEHAASRAQIVRNALAVLSGERFPALTGRPSTGVGFRALRERLAGDGHRPRYHLSPPANWLNDPNGLVRWNDTYHVFYQYNPAGPFHDTIHWGHATSDDLVHWTDEPVALAPSPDGPDRDGCWSGCAVPRDGVVTMLYTGGRGRQQLPCMATNADEGLDTWVKDPGNPIIESPPDAFDALTTEHWEAEFRDHCVWRSDGTWYQAIGSGRQDGCGAVLLYESTDLREWEYVGPLHVGTPDESAPVWECPELLEFEDGCLLHVSEEDRVTYFVGAADFDEPGFEVESSGLLDYGNYYAPQSMTDGDRYLTWAWLPEARGTRAQWDAGWSGVLSLPRVLDLADGELRQRPAPELRELRERRAAEEAFTLAKGEHRPLDVRGRALEFELDVELDGADEFGLVVRESPAASERTPIRYTGGEVVVERANSSHDPAADASEQRMPVAGDGLTLRAFVDGSVVEVFANRRRCLTSRIYPTRDDSTGASVYARGGAATVGSLSVWHLEPVWPAGDR